MASGLSTSQGWSPQMVAGMEHVPVYQDKFLMNQLAMTSTPVNQIPFGQNQTQKFGKSKKKSSLSKINEEINYLKHV
jgi:hypothetical protein